MNDPRLTYWHNLKRSILTQLNWIGTKPEDRLWLLDKAIRLCQEQRAAIQGDMFSEPKKTRP